LGGILGALVPLGGFLYAALFVVNAPQPEIGAALFVVLVYALIGAFLGGVAGKLRDGFSVNALGDDRGKAGPPSSSRLGELSAVLGGYRCPRCSSSDLTRYGGPSPLDGKRGFQCKTCQLEMGPSRSRFILWLLLLIAVLLGCVTLGAFLLILLVLRQFHLLVLAGFLFCVVCIIVGIRELRKPVPIKVNSSPESQSSA
jgi:hypothetical protein